MAGMFSGGPIWVKRVLFLPFLVPFLLILCHFQTFLVQIIAMLPLFCPKTSLLSNKKSSQTGPLRHEC